MAAASCLIRPALGAWLEGAAEPKVNLKQSPSMDRSFYYDTILHSTERLAFLVESAAPRGAPGQRLSLYMGTGECVPAGAGAWRSR